MVPVKAEIVVLNGLSSHADHGDLLRMLGPLAPTTRVRLVHGEPDRATKLADGLKGIGFADVVIPDRGESRGGMSDRFAANNSCEEIEAQ